VPEACCFSKSARRPDGQLLKLFPAAAQEVNTCNVSLRSCQGCSHTAAGPHPVSRSSSAELPGVRVKRLCYNARLRRDGVRCTIPPRDRKCETRCICIPPMALTGPACMVQPLAAESHHHHHLTGPLCPPTHLWAHEPLPHRPLRQPTPRAHVAPSHIHTSVYGDGADRPCMYGHLLQTLTHPPPPFLVWLAPCACKTCRICIPPCMAMALTGPACMVTSFRR
jgi:hypothetical protein